MNELVVFLKIFLAFSIKKLAKENEDHFGQTNFVHKQMASLKNSNGHFEILLHILFLKQENSFEDFETSSKFGEKNSGFVKTRFMEPSDEQISRKSLRPEGAENIPLGSQVSGLCF